MVVLRNCRLIGALTEGYDGDICDVAVSNGNIQAIESPGHDFGAAKEIDIAGKTLMPGMYDLHTHISYTGFGDMHDGGRDAYRTVLDTVEQVQNCLKAGFTTLRDSGGEPFLCARVKEAIDSGCIVGPNLSVCGRLMSPTEAGNNANPFVVKTIHEIDSLESIRKAVREEVRDGADYIKYVASGGISLKGSDPFAPLATFEEIRTLVEEAAFKRRYVAAHAYGAENIKTCLKAGCKTIEHGALLDEECIEILKQGKAFIVFTVSGAGRRLAEQDDQPAYAKYMQSEAAARIRKGTFESLKWANDEGLVCGLGTDAGMTNCFHGKNAMELVYRVRYGGIDAISALKHATIHSAIIMDEQEKKGTVKAGKVADLIVVDGKPDEDIECIANSVVMVMKAGEIVCNAL